MKAPGALFIFACLCLLSACSGERAAERLPVLGEYRVEGSDTIYPAVASFSLINQDGKVVTEQTFSDKVYVADFIFLSCPTICPKMNENMLRIYRQFEKDPNVLFISHTIDPERDSVPRLKEFSNSLELAPGKWHFVTGNKDSILSLAEKSYFSTAYQDSTAPGGYAHSGALLLVDRSRHLRGVYDGTDSSETQRLIKDLKILLKEQF
jgi:protein SCO1/2